MKQILAFSRQTELKRAPINIYSITKEAIKLIKAVLPSEIRINTKIDMIDEYVLADSTEIHQIIMNLCTNARDAMAKKGGVLTCSLKEIKITRNHTYNQRNISPGAYVKLSVEDTGDGIPEKIMDRIFEPYFTTKEEEQGTGLGLATVHGIVTDCGGHICVESQAGIGTTFDIYFPIYKKKQKAIKGEQRENAGGHGEKILFVDDEPTIAELVKISLEKKGYRVTSFLQSREALTVFEHNPDAFQVVITDMTMPEINGYELAKSIRRLRQNVPIIICTGFNEKIDSSKVKKFGLAHLIMKPFSGADLANAVEKVLSKKV